MLPVLADSVRLTDDGVHILDRRAFPMRREWVTCRTVEEVATAIEDMVTQSSGPYFAALYGMVLAARENPTREFLEQAGARLIATRPTNNHLRIAVDRILSTVDVGLGDILSITQATAGTGVTSYRARSRKLGRYTAELLPPAATVLTHCWADLYLVELVLAARKSGKQLAFVCTETRPYLQGTRLTAATLAELGVDTTVITDGMGAAVLAEQRIDALVTAGDRVTMDGHVVNKIGTLGLAIAAREFGVPFLAMVHAPDRNAPTASDVPIEYRPGEEVLTMHGQRVVPGDEIKGYYPAFDVTPPRFVTTVVTDKGAFAPGALADYYTEGDPA